MTDPKVTNINIKKIEFKFNHPAFNNIDVQAKIKSLLPSTEMEIIHFHIKNANTALVNGLKRVVEGEMKVKMLTFDISDINTHEDFIKYGELIDRINSIPINQDLDLDAEFALNVTNNDPKKEFMNVYSSDIIQISGKKPSKIAFPETIRISELRPGKYLVIPKIKIVEGYGFENAYYCLTHEIIYHITDFIPVTFINERANFVDKRVKTEDLLLLFKKYKINYKDEPENLFEKKILIIPNKSYRLMLTESQLKRITSYNIIVENPENWEVDCPNFDDKFLKEYHSTEIKATSFFLSIQTYGNIDPKIMMHKACDNLIKRLKKLKNAIIEKEKEKEIDESAIKTEGFVSIMKDDLKTQILIRGEDYTISQLLKITIFELDPNIGLINDPLEHPLNRTIMLNIKHPQPIKILLDAIDVCIKNYEKIDKQFP